MSLQNGSHANGQHGSDKSNGTAETQAISPVPPLWITGLGSQYPPHLSTPDKFDKLAKRLYGEENPGINKLLNINKATGIEARPSVRSYESGYGRQAEAPSIIDIDKIWRQAGVDLTVQACKKALKEWGGDYSDITHTIGVTCTNSTTPGYDLLVAQKLGLRDDLDRMLLNGVGCAGGMATMRAAAEIACGATARRRPARILGFACELCTLNVRCNLDETAKTDPANVSVAGVLFSDAAVAYVLCNDIAMKADVEDEPEEDRALFQLLEWGNTIIPNTIEYMGFCAEPNGYRSILTGDVPAYTNDAVRPMYEKLLPSFRDKLGVDVKDADIDWALHPEGSTIIAGVQEKMRLTNEQLRATKEIYKTKGNSSSPTTLIVLDKLRHMGKGRDHVVAAAFGPGLAIEMAMIRRCRPSED